MKLFFQIIILDALVGYSGQGDQIGGNITCEGSSPHSSIPLFIMVNSVTFLCLEEQPNITNPLPDDESLIDQQRSVGYGGSVV